MLPEYHLRLQPTPLFGFSSQEAKDKIRAVAFVRETDVTGITAINFYRAQSPLTTLAGSDERFAIEMVSQNRLREVIKAGLGDSLLGHHVYVTSRLFAGERGRGAFLDAIHESGGIVVFDTDDDLTDDHRDLGRGGDFKGILSDVDAITVSTPYLAGRLEPYSGNGKPVVLPNHVDAAWFAGISRAAKRRVQGLTVGLIGTASHYNDWKYPVEALKRIGMKYPDVTIVAAGYVPDYLKELPNLLELNPTPYTSYPALMRQFDIVCCSLDPDDEFNKSKSSIKALEAMAAARALTQRGRLGGAVPVCTDMTVYRRTVYNKRNGLLIDNSDWYEALSLLIENEPLRHRLADNGYRWARKNRDIRTGYRMWAKAYLKMLGREHGTTEQSTNTSKRRNRRRRR